MNHAYDRSWPFLSVNKVFNGTDWHFRFGPESGRSEYRYQDRADVSFWPKADVRSNTLPNRSHDLGRLPKCLTSGNS